MPNYKELHDKWKKAKNNAKLVYDGWAKLYKDVSDAGSKVVISVPVWPKFDMDLGPSLDKMEKNKDFDKNKAKALKAVKQYKADIKDFCGLAEKIAAEDPQRLKFKEALLKYLEALEKVRKEIKDALDE